MELILLAVLLAQPAIQDSPTARAPVEQGVVAKEDTKVEITLLQVHRICVESFGDDSDSRQLQAMVINALNESKKFTITENCSKSDATLKGITTAQVHQESHSTSESTGIRTGTRGADISDSSHSTETMTDAHLAVRLVAIDSGDVIWSTTQESKGAKYKGAGADAAEKVVKQLLWDLDKAQKKALQEAGAKTTSKQ